MEVINRFPERLKQAMTDAKISSNSHLARETDLSEATIRKYLKGETYPTLDRLALIADACHCSLSWLASGEGDPAYVSMPIEKFETIASGNNDKRTEFEHILDHLSHDQRQKFLKVIYTRGISSILQLDSDIDAQFMALNEDEKLRLLRLSEQVKKGASIGREEDDLDHPTPQRAGRA